MASSEPGQALTTVMGAPLFPAVTLRPTYAQPAAASARSCRSQGSVEALEIFKQQPADYDLVITDMTMPHLTGDNLARKLIAVRADIPIIICTGFNESLTPAKSEAIGIKAFLMKPLNIQELATTIRRVLGK